ncbi:hypothetical protein Nepgr_027647 [Nepenthes gracilis]|uniref:Transcription repressor n=1 Tax=Nepenthes gracilis TaxID=150966 RepID=A0AAD3TBB3_NEPGR|nr:hypothetical protein Nepgr_027647 [Nepenthes gracilis]
MPSSLGKNLHRFFSMIKRPQIAHKLRTPEDHSRQPPAEAASSSSSNACIKNYNSLYDFPSPAFKPATGSFTDDHFAATSHAGSVDIAASTIPDIATAYASHRFFFSTPGRSNSIIDSSSSSSSLREASTVPRGNDSQLAAGGVAVQTYSPDPYVDFRRSMQEMVEARDLMDVKSNWDYLHELLLCYLSLNPTSTHEFIIRAFADLLVSLVSSATGAGRDSQFPAGSGGCGGGGCACN